MIWKTKPSDDTDVVVEASDPTWKITIDVHNDAVLVRLPVSVIDALKSMQELAVCFRDDGVVIELPPGAIRAFQEMMFNEASPMPVRYVTYRQVQTKLLNRGLLRPMAQGRDDAIDANDGTPLESNPCGPAPPPRLALS